MKKLISVVVMAGVMSQIANAMGPAGDTTHRHLYKDQEWIWGSQVNQPKPEAAKALGNQASTTSIWHLPTAFLLPHHPGLAFLVPRTPTQPGLAFLVPVHPGLAFLVPRTPTQPGLAFLVPVHPGLAFPVRTTPTKPSLAFLVPHNPGLAFLAPTTTGI
jgi:hypothetical protein